MHALLTGLGVTLALIAGFGLLVLIHEWGHFFVARRVGIRAEAFSIGFGPVLWKKQHGETEYRVSLLPLGGYVKMTGEDPDDPAAATDPRSFAAQSIPKRVAVILAGPLMNILLALALMPLTFLIGRERPAFERTPAIINELRAHSAADVAGLRVGDRLVRLAGRPVATWADVQDALVLAGKERIDVAYERDGASRTAALTPSWWGLGFHPSTFILNEPLIDSITPNSVAARAGIGVGERIRAINGVPIAYWDEATTLIGAGRNAWTWWWVARTWSLSPDTTATIGEYLRGAPLQLTLEDPVRRLHTVAIELPRDAASGRYLLGVGHDPDAAWARVPKYTRRYGLVGSITHGVQEIGRLTNLLQEFIGRLVTKPAEHYTSLAGPVRIFSMFAQITQEGLSPYLYFLAFFSLQLGLLNLLPIPILDGGHLLLLTAEGIARRKLPIKVREVIQYIGLFFLLGMLIVVTTNDLRSFAWVRALLAKVW